MRRLTGEDAALWQRAMRGVAPLPGRSVKDPPPQAGEVDRPTGGPEGAASVHRPINARQSPQPPAPPLDRFAGIDRATADRLRRGQRDIEAQLDLHGLTQAEAHRALAAFVTGSRVAGRRCVLVITGHGRMSGGILKGAVPRWLHEPELRRHILAIAPARPQHGGAGALYLLLRKRSGS